MHLRLVGYGCAAFGVEGGAVCGDPPGCRRLKSARAIQREYRVSWPNLVVPPCRGIQTRRTAHRVRLGHAADGRSGAGAGNRSGRRYRDGGRHRRRRGHLPHLPAHAALPAAQRDRSRSGHRARLTHSCTSPSAGDLSRLVGVDCLFIVSDRESTRFVVPDYSNGFDNTRLSSSRELGTVTRHHHWYRRRRSVQPLTAVARDVD